MLKKALYYLVVTFCMLVLTPPFCSVSVLGTGGFWGRLAGHYMNVVHFWRVRFGYEAPPEPKAKPKTDETEADDWEDDEDDEDEASRPPQQREGE